jgi:hypothetical protein
MLNKEVPDRVQRGFLCNKLTYINGQWPEKFVPIMLKYVFFVACG